MEHLKPDNPKKSEAELIGGYILEDLGVTILASYVKPSGLTGKDIDIVYKVSPGDYEKIIGKDIFTENLVYESKPIDIFVTDGKRVMVSVQISPQRAEFMEKPPGLGRKLKISKETLSKLSPWKRNPKIEHLEDYPKIYYLIKERLLKGTPIQLSGLTQEDIEEKTIKEILEGYRDLEEAKEDARTLKKTGGVRYSALGYEVSPEAIEWAIRKVKENMERKAIANILREKNIPVKKEFIDFITKLRKLPPMAGIKVSRQSYNIQSEEEKFYMPLAKAGIISYTLARDNKVIIMLRQDIRKDILKRMVGEKTQEHLK